MHWFSNHCAAVCKRFALYYYRIVVCPVYLSVTLGIVAKRSDGSMCHLVWM